MRKEFFYGMAMVALVAAACERVDAGERASRAVAPMPRLFWGKCFDSSGEGIIAFDERDNRLVLNGMQANYLGTTDMGYTWTLAHFTFSTTNYLTYIVTSGDKPIDVMTCTLYQEGVGI